MPHDFQTKLLEGERWELALDNFFSKWYTIQPVDRQGQRAGVDRLWTRPDGSVLRIEYKADSVCWRTGNVFLEVVSVDTSGKTGWVWSSQADLLVYLMPQVGKAFLVEMAALRWAMGEWSWKYPTKTADNGTYRTHGVCVPIWEFWGIAAKVMCVEVMDGSSRSDRRLASNQDNGRVRSGL